MNESILKFKFIVMKKLFCLLMTSLFLYSCSNDNPVTGGNNQNTDSLIFYKDSIYVAGSYNGHEDLNFILDTLKFQKIRISFNAYTNFDSCYEFIHSRFLISYFVNDSASGHYPLGECGMNMNKNYDTIVDLSSLLLCKIKFNFHIELWYPNPQYFIKLKNIKLLKTS